MINLLVMMTVLFCGAASGPAAPFDVRDAIAKEFAGVYRFDYLFIESGNLHVAVRIKPAATLPNTTAMQNDGNVRPRCSPGRHPP